MSREDTWVMPYKKRNGEWLVKLVSKTGLVKEMYDFKSEYMANEFHDSQVNGSGGESFSLTHIANICCEKLDVSLKDLKSKSRKQELVTPRHMSMYMAKVFTNNSLKSIGTFYGGRDHSTVIHAINTMEDICDTNAPFKRRFEKLKTEIENDLEAA